jgi:GntR family transcriptional repressor for pyruvate dehydrogenase complex
MALLRRIPTRRVGQQVRDQLRELVFSGAFGPGEKLPSERELTEALGVSRTAVREALHGLAAIGLVTVRHGAGAFVAARLPGTQGAGATLHTIEDHPQAPEELIELRLIVEPEVCALAATRATADDLERLREDTLKFHAELGVLRRPPADLRFHLDLCKAAHNRPLLIVTQWVIQFYAKSGQRPLDRDVSDHQRIYEAVRARAPDRARTAMRKHLEWVRHRLQTE